MRLRRGTSLEIAVFFVLSIKALSIFLPGAVRSEVAFALGLWREEVLPILGDEFDRSTFLLAKTRGSVRRVPGAVDKLDKFSFDSVDAILLVGGE